MKDHALSTLFNWNTWLVEPKPLWKNFDCHHSEEAEAPWRSFLMIQSTVWAETSFSVIPAQVPNMRVWTLLDKDSSPQWLEPFPNFWVTPSHPCLPSRGPETEEQRQAGPIVSCTDFSPTETMSIIKWLLLYITMFWDHLLMDGWNNGCQVRGVGQLQT